jgi:hypothetical protein
LTGAAITVLALAEPFIAAGAAVAFIRCFFIVFKRCSWSRRTASAWFFFATEKELSPRGYERKEIMNASWVPPSTWKKIKKFISSTQQA